MMWDRTRIVALLVVSAVRASAAPEMDSISPLAVRPGVPSEITLSGSDVSDATQLWTSFPARTESLGKGRFRIIADAPLNIGALRAIGSNGVSNLGFIVGDPLPVVAEGKINNARTAAQSIDFGSSVDGRVEELSYDWFKFRANKGQRVSVETVAARIGSKLDSVLRLVNAAGRELARNDDWPGASGDSYLSFHVPETGDYFIELRDVNYGGDSAFFYHLRVGSFSPLPSRFASSTDDTRVVAEKEPNDLPAKATKISLRDQVSGRFNKLGDRDVFAFTSSKDQRLEIRAATRSLGSPCDVVLQLDSAEGKRLARSNPTAAEEGTLTHNFTSNTTYRLTVEEVTGAFGSNIIYQLSARPVAGFSLTLDTDRVNVAPGKSFELKVTAARGDYKGAVTLALQGLAETFAVTNHVIAEGKSNVTMRVTVPAALTPGMPQTFSVLGTAQRGSEKVSSRASTAPALRRALPLVLFPPPELDGIVILGITTQ